ncbi:MAG TPA: SIMPL domain-containing protein [Chthoniobacterales bacterium]
MKKLVLLACVSLPLSLLAEGGLPDKPYIYVEGKAEIEKPADMVTLRFDLVARNPDQAKANQEVQAKATKVFALMDARKIAESDVVATDLRSEPQYENEEESGRKRGKIIGYGVTRSFTVKIRDVTAFAKLVDELLAIGGTEFSGIDAGLSKEKEMQDEVWDKALLNGRERAEKTLKAIGMKIDSVFAVSPVTFPEIQSKFFASSLPVSSYAARELAKPDPTQYRLAPITISQGVHILYLISPAK